MKTSQIFRTLWMFILFPIILWASAEQEVLVLSKPNFLQMPDGRDSADVDEITAPQVVIDCLQNIGAVMIIKALPNFYPADTYRITEDGTIARLPNFSHLLKIPRSMFVKPIKMGKNLSFGFGTFWSLFWTR